MLQRLQEGQTPAELAPSSFLWSPPPPLLSEINFSDISVPSPNSFISSSAYGFLSSSFDQMLVCSILIPAEAEKRDMFGALVKGWNPSYLYSLHGFDEGMSMRRVPVSICENTPLGRMLQFHRNIRPVQEGSSLLINAILFQQAQAPWGNSLGGRTGFLESSRISEVNKLLHVMFCIQIMIGGTQRWCNGFVAGPPCGWQSEVLDLLG